jgi:tRNA(Ile)-lysidine synthetase-like protein
MAKARARCAIEAVLLEFLSKQGFAPEERMAVAYSGGPDSTALLVALRSLGWRDIVAIHVDHGLRPRPELEAELALVKSLCADLGAKLIVARLKPGAVRKRAETSGEGIESAARRYRRAALRAAAKKSGAKMILLAHTRDDQIETTLMRLLGGSGAGGLRGIPEIFGPFARPFLGIGKAELLAYLDERARKYSVDSTNASGQYLRNRIRSRLVPALDESFPGWRKGIARAAAKAALDETALGAEAEALGFAPSGDGCLSCLAAPLLGAAEAVAVRAILRAAGRALGAERLSSDWAAAALRALRRGEGAVYGGRGLELRIRDGKAILRRTSEFQGRGLDFPRRDGYFVSIDRPCQVRVGKLEVRAEWREAFWNSDGGSGIREDAFRFPLVVRSRRPGDAIALKEGTKRLDALFSEWGMPESSRGKAPIVEDRDGIVAVLGAGIGGKDRYRARGGDDRPNGEARQGRGRCLSVIVKGA